MCSRQTKRVKQTRTHHHYYHIRTHQRHRVGHREGKNKTLIVEAGAVRPLVELARFPDKEVREVVMGVFIIMVIVMMARARVCGGEWVFGGECVCGSSRARAVPS